MCECISKIDEMLKPHNTRLALTIVFSSPSGAYPSLGTERIETGRGKPKAMTMLPTFCPFCGEKYPSKTGAPNKAATP